MRAYKNKSNGFVILVALLVLNICCSLFLNNPSAEAQVVSGAALQQQALVDCAKQYGVGSNQYNQFKANSPGKDCINSYVIVYQDASQAIFDGVCAKLSPGTPAQAGCLIGRTLGQKARQANQPSGGGGGTTLTDAQIKAIAANDSACQVGSSELKNACIAGFLRGYKGASNNCGSAFNGRATNKCTDGWNAGKEAKKNGVTIPKPIDPAASSAAIDACKKYDPNAKPRPDTANQTYFDDCVNGYMAAKAGKTQKEACEDGYNPGPSKDACLVGYNAATGNDGGDDTSACVAHSHTSLEWLFCPLITAISKGADQLNNAVESQLDFSTDNFLPDSGDNIGAYRAWSVIKDLATSLLIIILLVMVFSQAAGSGIFEAYTIRKILPRLVIAVIAMQLSWQLCIFAIHLANDLGNGLAQLITAPFGGAGNLDLSSLLNHLSGLAAGATSLTLTTAVVSGIFLGTVFLPGAFMIIFSVLITVLVGLASVLFRNIIIIACVIFAPIALILWVIPNQSTKKYWGMWSSNFTNALLLFPIMVGLIYGGRIFAYVAGGVGKAGFLDLIMVLVGFFAPYAILPKAFKWGGSWTAAGANLIASNGAVKKARELNKKEMGGLQQRRLNKYAKDLDPSHDDYAKYTGRKWGVIPTWQGKLGKTAFQNLRAGRVLPTKRNLAVTLKRGDEWNSEEDAIAAALLKRQRDKATGNPSRMKAYKLEDVRDDKGNVIGSTIKEETVENPTSASKMAIMRAMGSKDTREAGVGVEQFLKSSSWVELGSNWVPLQDNDTKLAVDGAEIKEDAQGNKYARPYELKRWLSKINASEELYPLPMGKWLMATPHIVASNPEEGYNDPTKSNAMPAQYAKMQREENEQAAREHRPAQKFDFQPLNRQQARAISVMQGYLDAGNIGSQSESEIKEFARLADPNRGGNRIVADEFAKLLERIGAGGVQGINVLGQLGSGASEKEAIDSVLKNAQIKAVVNGKSASLTLDHIKTQAQTKMEGKVQPSAATTETEQEPGGTVSSTPATTQTEGTGAAAAGAGAGAAGAGAGGASGLPGTFGGPEGGFNFEAMTEAVARGTERGQRRTGERAPSVINTEKGEVTVRLHGGENFAPTPGGGRGQVVLTPGAQYELGRRQDNPTPPNNDTTNPPTPT
jgi:hypothetical protein